MGACGAQFQLRRLGVQVVYVTRSVWSLRKLQIVNKNQKKVFENISGNKK